MKTRDNLIGLIAKKCFKLKVDKNIDAFFQIEPHVHGINVEVFKNWDHDKEPIYKSTKYFDGILCSRSNQIEVLRCVLEDLDAIYYGLGVE